jgi:signal peptidase I
MQKRERSMASHAAGQKPEEGLWETVKVILQALAIAFFVRTFFFQPFNIPSASMYPTLMIGDYIFVSKLSYGYGKYSFNFSFGGFGENSKPWIWCCPVDFPGRSVLPDLPERGDIAVFKLPSNTEIDYVKRVIGLPGDHIQMTDGVLQINGKAVPKVRIEDYIDPAGDANQHNMHVVPQFQETLPNGVTYRVLDINAKDSLDNTGEYVVPEGHYFMMGDNRDNSQDSRVLGGGVGYVPLENFVGRADIIFFSISPDARLWEVWKWPFEIRWLRFFNLLG